MLFYIYLHNCCADITIIWATNLFIYWYLLASLGRRQCGRWLIVFRQFDNCCFRSWRRWVHLVTGTTLYSRMACFAILDCLVSLFLSIASSAFLHRVPKTGPQTRGSNFLTAFTTGNIVKFLVNPCVDFHYISAYQKSVKIWRSLCHRPMSLSAVFQTWCILCIKITVSSRGQQQKK